MNLKFFKFFDRLILLSLVVMLFHPSWITITITGIVMGYSYLYGLVKEYDRRT